MLKGQDPTCLAKKLKAKQRRNFIFDDDVMIDRANNLDEITTTRQVNREI
jgi:hypothetical protein